VLADALAFDEDHGLHEQFGLAGLALHVVDGFTVPHVGIKSKNRHKASKYPGSDRIF
jgi:hypothetical protein